MQEHAFHMEISHQQIIPGAGHPIKALLLDDSAIDRRHFRRISDKSGLALEVKEAPTISEMSRMIQKEHFDIIFIDYNLTNETGLDALAEIKRTGSHDDTAVIMLTGQKQTDVAISAFRNGCCDYVDKDELTPLQVHDMMLTAQNQMQARQMQAVAHILQPTVQAAISTAFRSGSFREMLADVVRDAIRETGTTNSDEDPQTLARIYAGLVQDDEFTFLSEPGIRAFG